MAMEPRKYFPQQVQHGFKPAFVGPDGGMWILGYTEKWFYTAGECQEWCDQRNAAQIKLARDAYDAARAQLESVLIVHETREAVGWLRLV